MAVETTNTVESKKTDVQDMSAEIAIGKNAKDINKTSGGRAINFITNWLIGFVFNSGLSVAITYTLNPKPWVKDFKKNTTNNLLNLFKIDREKNPTAFEKTEEQVRSGVEITFMYVSGIITTLIMTPLVANREKIAYRINKMLGKDLDVLPEHLPKRDHSS